MGNRVKYNYEWYLRHRTEVIQSAMKRNKTVGKEYYKAYQRKYQRTFRQKLREKFVSLFGTKCWICGYHVSCHSKRTHEINGIKHKPTDYNYYLVNFRRFSLVCNKCHLLLHKLMECGYSFEEILMILKWEIIKEQESN